MSTPTYEYRQHPLDKARVEVRRKPINPHHPGRRHNWRTYMQTNSEADARRILSMLLHNEPESVATP